MFKELIWVTTKAEIILLMVSLFFSGYIIRWYSEKKL